MSTSYSKKEKLKSKKLIDQLFTEGQYVSSYPLRLVYLPNNSENTTITKTAVSVSKRNFKSAVNRNRIKRLLRESYRLNKTSYFTTLKTPHIFMILYIGKETPTLNQIEKKMNHLFEKFSNKITQAE